MRVLTFWEAILDAFKSQNLVFLNAVSKLKA